MNAYRSLGLVSNTTRQPKQQQLQHTDSITQQQPLTPQTTPHHTTPNGDALLAGHHGTPHRCRRPPGTTSFTPTRAHQRTPHRHRKTRKASSEQPQTSPVDSLDKQHSTPTTTSHEQTSRSPLTTATTPPLSSPSPASVAPQNSSPNTPTKATSSVSRGDSPQANTPTTLAKRSTPSTL